MLDKRSRFSTISTESETPPETIQHVDVVPEPAVVEVAVEPPVEAVVAVTPVVVSDASVELVEDDEDEYHDVERAEAVQSLEAIQAELIAAGSDAEEFVESLESLVVTIENVISTGRASKAVTDLLSSQIADKLKTAGLSHFQVAVESFEDDNVGYLNASLEGLRDILWGIWQGEAIRLRRVKDAFVDSFMSYEANATSYQKRFARYKAVLSQSDVLWEKKNQTVDQSGLVMPFASNKAIANRLPDFKSDLDVSEYILKEYPAVVVREAKKVQDIIAGGDFTSFESILKTVVSKLKGIKHPAHLFEEKYLGPDKYFGCSGFVTVVGKEPKIDVEELEVLKTLATPAYVDIKRNKMHMVADTLHSIPVTLGGALVAELNGFKYVSSLGTAVASGMAIGALQASAGMSVLVDAVIPSFTINKEGFNTLFKAGDDYVKLLAEVQHNTVPLWQSVISLSEAMVAKVSKKQMDNTSETKAVIALLNKIVTNYSNCLIYPLVNELPRVNKNLRNTYYLATYAVKRAK